MKTEKIVNVIEIEKIIKTIPHRYPFLLVDKVLLTEDKNYSIGIKNVTINELFFVGHFPKKPVMPGVLIIESMAQTSVVSAMNSPTIDPSNKLVYFMSIDGVKFRKPVVPSDVLKLHVKTIRNRGNVRKLSAIAKVEENIVAEACFSAMILDKKVNE